MLLKFRFLTLLFCHASFFFLIIDLYFLIPWVIIQIFNTTAELIIPRRMSTKERKVKIETHPVTVEVNISSW